jgi:glycosyltransferase involved in cell wall biosynthesis
MISIICVYNNEWILRNYLLKSLSQQKTAFELITIDNTENRFRSAAAALNWGGKQAAGDWLMFVHQDVDLCSGSWFDNLEALLGSLPNLGIAGVAGMRERGATLKERYRNIPNQRPLGRARNAITHGPQRQQWGAPILQPEPVQTLDECLVIIPKSVFKVLQFDEATCSDWHLYAVDYCLSVKTRGFGVYVIPKYLHHQSMGVEKSSLQVLTSFSTYSEEYYRTLKRIMKKHKNQFKWIHTSCGSWNVAYPFTLQRANIALDYVIIAPVFRHLLSPLFRKLTSVGR